MDDSSDNNCLFCHIVAGDIPAEKVYEDEKTLAFLDINPVNKGHTLVIPKKHTENALTIDTDTFLSVMRTVHLLLPAVTEGMEAAGVNVGINNLPAAGQEVFHLHVHIMPRFEGDGYRLWSGTPYTAQEEMQAVAERIRKRLI